MPFYIAEITCLFFSRLKCSSLPYSRIEVTGINSDEGKLNLGQVYSGELELSELELTNLK